MLRWHSVAPSSSCQSSQNCIRHVDTLDDVFHAHLLLDGKLRMIECRRYAYTTMSFTLLLHLWTLVSLLIVGIDAFASVTTSTKSTAHHHSSSLVRASSSTHTDHDDKKSSLTLFSPCKINLFLRILRKRPDGFHDLASLFQCIGFGDVLQLQISEQQDAFECNMPGVPVDSTNLVVRAINVMRKKTGNESQKFNVKLTKQVPAQAGLGGGSANAATAMWGANELMGKPATLNEMVEWSAELGSDITFFLSRGTAYCTGRGEIMTPVDPPLESGTPVCLVKPNVGLSTPSVFSALDYDLLSTVDPEELLEDFVQHGVYGVQKESFLNDLEPPAFKCVPMLRTLKEELQQVPGFTQVLMSGSGSTIFCIGSPKDKEAFMKEFGEREDLQVFFSEFINRKEGEWFERPKGVE